MGNKLVQVLVPPWQAGGALFDCPRFRECFSSVFPHDLESEGETWFSEHKGTLLSNAADLRYGKANVTPLAQAAGGHDLLAHGSSNGEIEPFWEA